MNSLDPSCVPEEGLKLQSVSVCKDKPKALSSLLCVGGLPGTGLAPRSSWSLGCLLGC